MGLYVGLVSGFSGLGFNIGLVWAFERLDHGFETSDNLFLTFVYVPAAIAVVVPFIVLAFASVLRGRRQSAGTDPIR